MKKYIFSGCLILALILSFNIHAQDKKPFFHREFSKPNKDCTPLSDLDTTDEQQTTIAQKQRFYREQAMTSKVLLLAKRLEFERMLNNPEAREDELKNKAEEIGQLTGKLETERFNLLIDIHQTLTPPQIEAWCTTIGKPFDKGKTKRTKR
jgi:Spy/CpxP family protein refolding chaperone